MRGMDHHHHIHPRATGNHRAVIPSSILPPSTLADALWFLVIHCCHILVSADQLDPSKRQLLRCRRALTAPAPLTLLLLELKLLQACGHQLTGCVILVCEDAASAPALANGHPA